MLRHCHFPSLSELRQTVERAGGSGVRISVAPVGAKHDECGGLASMRAQAAARPFEHRVLVRPTMFQSFKAPETDKRLEFQALYQALVDDDARTRRICEDVVDAVGQGRSPLILTERNEHLERLAQTLTPHVRHVIVLRAGMGKKQSKAASERLTTVPREEARVVIATGKYVGEGFDDPRLDTLFLTLPVSWRGTITQYAGRLHRLYDGKREVRTGHAARPKPSSFGGWRL